MNKKRKRLIYIISDALTATTAWVLFYIFRKIYIESGGYGYKVPLIFNESLNIAIFAIPLFWLSIYFISGYYRNVYRKSRLKELWLTFSSSLTGLVILFFALIIDDVVFSYKHYYASASFLFISHFTLTYIFRLCITTNNIKKIRTGKISFNTLMIGSNGKAFKLYKDLMFGKDYQGNKFVGFINMNNNPEDILSEYIPHLGNFDNLRSIVEDKKIEEVILAIESSKHEDIEQILFKLQGTDVLIKVLPSLIDLLTGQIRISGFIGQPLMIISHRIMPPIQAVLKKIIDILLSAIAIILLSPFLPIISILIKQSSKGSIFFKQERIGKNGKPFMIYKFRSMIIEAESGTPQLSSEDDSRITSFGKFMRKTRIDEIPQFFNVLKGDMSLVGPRPERQYYIDKIVQTAPYYLRLLRVKPGITSWGQVKYGYAENIEQMLERLDYDILYIENMSLYYDFKIAIYTIKTILKGSGK